MWLRTMLLSDETAPSKLRKVLQHLHKGCEKNSIHRKTMTDFVAQDGRNDIYIVRMGNTTHKKYSNVK